ncbi:MAG: DUF2887 domain-containing protein [Cyanobacteriota bacterium]
MECCLLHRFLWWRNYRRFEEVRQSQGQEIKETAFRLDGIFLPSQREIPLYFVEVQFQPDPSLYFRLLAEIHLFLRQYEPECSWKAVVMYPNVSLDLGIPVALQESTAQIVRVYLDELPESPSPLLGIVKLIVDPPVQARRRAEELLHQDLSNELLELMILMMTVLVYKFADCSREAIEAMFGLSDLKQTRVYQEAQQEGEANLTLKQLRHKLKLTALPLTLSPQP